MLSIVLLTASKAAIAITPLLYHGYRPVPGIRGRSVELQLSSNIAPRFEDTKHKETCLPDLSGQKWEVHKLPSILISEEGFIALTPILYSQPRVEYFITHFIDVT